VIEVNGERERVVGRFIQRNAAVRLRDDMIREAGRLGLMIAYFIEAAKGGKEPDRDDGNSA